MNAVRQRQVSALPSHPVSQLQLLMKYLALAAGLFLAVLLGCSIFAAPPPQDSLTPQERRGKQIYVQGQSASGQEILAYLGEAALEVPGSSMACANCHGLEGEGKSEGGIVPSNLTWEALTKPYGVTHPNGRKHPPYTERALELAITRGLDPAGNKLLNVMPRYQMSKQDLADLVTYLKRLGTDRDPGISENRIVIGAVVPTRGALAEMGQAVRAVTTAYFDDINAQGGIYNRRIELKFAETAETASATSANVARLLQDEQVFALTNVFTAGADKELVALAESREVPLIGPLTLLPQTASPPHRHIFYLLSGLNEQARALVTYAFHAPTTKTSLAILYPQNEMSAVVVAAIKEQCRKEKCGTVETYEYAPSSFDAAAKAQQLSRAGQANVFFFGTGDEALALMREATKLRWTPALYLPGAVGGNSIFDAPPEFSRKVFFSFPASPDSQTPAGISSFRSLADKYQLPAHHLAAQFSAYSAAKILVEGLKRAGKDLSREKLISALEGFYEFDTGLTPPISYGPNRRIGAMGAYIVSIDLEKHQYIPVSAWISVN